MSQPAFPTMGRFIEADGTKLQDAAEPGMTLRDYFAAKSMASFTPAIETLIQNDATSVIKGLRSVANFSYAMADAMLAEREK